MLSSARGISQTQPCPWRVFDTHPIMLHHGTTCGLVTCSQDSQGGVRKADTMKDSEGSESPQGFEQRRTEVLLCSLTES